MADVAKFICGDLHLTLALNVLLKRTIQGLEAAYQRIILPADSGLLLEVGCCKLGVVARKPIQTSTDLALAPSKREQGAKEARG